MNDSWTEERGKKRYIISTLWDYCDQGTAVEYMRDTHGVFVVIKRKAYTVFHAPKSLSLALQITLVEMLRQLTEGCLEYETIDAVCGDLMPDNIMVRRDREKYRFILTSKRPLSVKDPALTCFPGKQYVCKAALQEGVLEDNKNKRQIAVQFQYFQLVWIVFSFTGVGEDIQDMLHDIRIIISNNNNNNNGEQQQKGGEGEAVQKGVGGGVGEGGVGGEANLADHPAKSMMLNLTADRLSFVPSESRKKLKRMITEHFSQKGAEALGALFYELLSFPRPSQEVVRQLLNIRKVGQRKSG